MKFIVFATLLAAASAAPGLYISEEANLIHTVPLTAKSTITKSSQVVDHGSTYIHSPIVHEVHSVVPVVHTIHTVPLVHAKTTVTKSNLVNHEGTGIINAPVHYVSEYHAPIKTTVTKSNQIVNHGGTTVIHAPVVPVHTPVVFKTGDSAVSHQSSTVHETKTAPLYAYHSYHY